MARIDNLTNFLTDIANAIRNKKGTEAPIAASDFDTEIQNIQSGSSMSKGIIYNELNSNGYPTDITINGLNKIPDGFFRNINENNGQFKNVINLTINGDIVSIAGTAFRECDDLIKLVLNSNEVPALVNVNAFLLTPIAEGTGYIYVLDSLLDDYKSATNWSTYATQIKPISSFGGI